ncbi:MAG: DoxX family membrane protein [Mycobacterium sp.]|nr:MAG: DoxX family membrane protein [Mycobacterium sp.]
MEDRSDRHPVASADFVGLLEIDGGVLLLLGLFTRFISVPFLVEMIVAMLPTKIAMVLGCRRCRCLRCRHRPGSGRCCMNCVR